MSAATSAATGSSVFTSSSTPGTPVIAAATVYAYRLPDESFAPDPDGTTGYWISTVAVEPLECVVLDDLVGRHREAGIHLESVGNLWPMWDQVVASTLEFSGVRLGNAEPRPSGTNSELMSLADFDRIPLLFGPSPVHRLERLSEHLGGEVADGAGSCSAPRGDVWSTSPSRPPVRSVAEGGGFQGSWAPSPTGRVCARGALEGGGVETLCVHRGGGEAGGSTPCCSYRVDPYGAGRGTCPSRSPTRSWGCAGRPATGARHVLGSEASREARVRRGGGGGERGGWVGRGLRVGEGGVGGGSRGRGCSTTSGSRPLGSRRSAAYHLARDAEGALLRWSSVKLFTGIAARGQVRFRHRRRRLVSRQGHHRGSLGRLLKAAG